MILCEFQHVHLVMLLLVLTSNEQETRVLLVLVFLMMTKPARQVGVQPPLPPGSGAAGRSPAGGATQVTPPIASQIATIIVYKLLYIL